MTQITKSTMIGELLQIDQNIAPILLNIGMHCLGCPSSQMETVEEAAMVHGIDPDALVKRSTIFLQRISLNPQADTRRKGYPGSHWNRNTLFLLLNAARPLKLCQRLKRMIFKIT